MLSRYNISELQQKAANGGSMTSREVAALALHELDISERSHGYELKDYHVRKADVYARIAQAIRGS